MTIKAALVNRDGHALHADEPYNGEHVLIAASYHEKHGVFKATNLVAQGTVVTAVPSLGGAIIVTGVLLSALKRNSAVVTLQYTDGVITEELFSAELTNSEVNLYISVPFGWRGWANAQLEVVLAGADSTIHVTTGYTKIPAGENYAEWDARR